MEEMVSILDLPRDIQKHIYIQCDCDTKVNLMKTGICPELIIGKVKMHSDIVMNKILRILLRKDEEITVLDFNALYPSIIRNDFDFTLFQDIYEQDES
mgnify:CR=1 FL=1